MVLRSCGCGGTPETIENSPSSAAALPCSSRDMSVFREAANAVFRAMAGIGGAFLSVFYTPLWVEGMVAGRGWISLALVVFATWRPLRVMLGAYLAVQASVALAIGYHARHSPLGVAWTAVTAAGRWVSNS